MEIINRKILTIDNMDKIINSLTSHKKYKKLIISREMKILCELNPDFDCPKAWNVQELKVNDNFKEKEFDLI